MVASLIRHSIGPRHHMPIQVPAASVQRALGAASTALPRGTAGTTGAAASARAFSRAGTAANNTMSAMANKALSFATNQFLARACLDRAEISKDPHILCDPC